MKKYNKKLHLSGKISKIIFQYELLLQTSILKKRIAAIVAVPLSPFVKLGSIMSNVSGTFELAPVRIHPLTRTNLDNVFIFVNTTIEQKFHKQNFLLLTAQAIQI